MKKSEHAEVKARPSALQKKMRDRQARLDAADKAEWHAELSKSVARRRVWAR